VFDGRAYGNVTDGYGESWPIDAPFWADKYDGLPLHLDGIDWLIVGGESGAQHRPMRLEWARALRDACLATRNEAVGYRHEIGGGTAFFFKQVGGRTPKAGGRLLDGRTWDEMPTAHTSGVAA
jgi:protein gp37